MALERVDRLLGEFYEFRSGLSKPASEFGSGHPFLTFKDVFYNYFVPDTLGDLVNSTDADRDAGDVKRGDVFLTRTSETMEELAMSCVALRDVPFATFNGFSKRLRPKPDSPIVPEYAGYFFRSPRFRREVTAMSSMSTRASLNNDMLGRLRITLPDVQTQAAIGATLKSLDDKIKQNRQTAHALERLTQAIFHAWFVDFEPVKAKAAGATAFPSMPQPVFDALPTRFVDSQLGAVPEGWEVKAFSSTCKLASGGTPKRSEAAYWGGDIPWYSVKDAPDYKEVWVLTTSERITAVGLAASAACVIPKGGTIISARGTVGKLAMAGVPMAFNQSCYGLVPGDGKSFGYLHLLTKSVVDELQQRTHGSVFDTITMDTFDGLLVASPRPEVVSAFEAAVAPLFAFLLTAVGESSKLAATRDYLLPELLTGAVQAGAING